MRVRVEVGKEAGVMVPEGPDKMTHFPEEITAIIEDAPWHVEMTLRMPGAVITELNVRIVKGGPEISPSMLRGVRLGEAVAAAVREAGQPMELRGDGYWYWAGGTATGRSARVARAKTKSERIDAEARQAAVIYRLIAAESAPGDVTARVAEDLGVGRTTAHRRIHRARELGYLDGV